MTVKHRGWAMVMGRVACGSRPGPDGQASEEGDVTCRRCLVKMVREAFGEVGRLGAELQQARNDHDRLRAQFKRLEK